ncbi:MAG: alpha,alpha-phosphotrehalase [Lachnospiraceae bacterium]|nr:alpha,alpha-phosphotrehalase [Lachnospiraceae bacterium]
MRSYSKSCVYQIYVKSFADSNKDGIGDIPGIIGKLDYLADLGVDYLWLTPFFTSPMNDNGYDVADYRRINPCFGTMEDVERLIAEAKKRGILLMFDMVFNHTSTEHEWFRRALAGEKEYQDYYIFKDPVDGKEPTNWQSKFGGSAWEFVPSLGKYYLHLFDRTQADLNWENPKVREELKQVIRFWKDKGVGGFRFDVVNLISKPAVWEDDTIGDGRRFYTDGPHVHEYLKELVADTGIADMMTVGEMSSTSVEQCIRYTRPSERELAMAFSFHHLKVDYKDGDKWSLMEPDFKQLRDLFATWQEQMQDADGWNALFFNNHDQPRAISRFGDDDTYRRESGKMLGLLIHGMRGTPYIYQGEEIGTPNAGFTTIDEYRDVESLNYYEILRANGKSEAEALEILAERSRDNGRTPMLWTEEEYAGFSEREPWLAFPRNRKGISVEEQMQQEDSILAFYRKLIQLRKELAVLSEGDIRFLDTPEGTIGYERRFEGQRLIVLCNLCDRAIAIPSEEWQQGELLLDSYEQPPTDVTMLRPYEGRARVQNEK